MLGFATVYVTEEMAVLEYVPWNAFDLMTFNELGSLNEVIGLYRNAPYPTVVTFVCDKSNEVRLQLLNALNLMLVTALPCTVSGMTNAPVGHTKFPLRPSSPLVTV